MTVYSLGYHRHGRTKTWATFFCPFLLGTAPILIAVWKRPRWLMACPLRCGPCRPSLQCPVVLEASRGSCRLATASEGLWGTPNPAVPIRTGEPLLYRGLLIWDQRVACVSVFILLVKHRARVFDQQLLHCFEHLSFHSWSYQISDLSVTRPQWCYACTQLLLHTVLFGCLLTEFDADVVVERSWIRSLRSWGLGLPEILAPDFFLVIQPWKSHLIPWALVC